MIDRLEWSVSYYELTGLPSRKELCIECYFCS